MGLSYGNKFDPTYVFATKTCSVERLYILL